MDPMLQHYHDRNKSDFLDLLYHYNVPIQFSPLSWLEPTDYFYAPASKRFHGAYPGGLYTHSKLVADTLINLTRKGIISTWERPESPILIGLLHDITKVNKYLAVPKEDGSMEYVDNPDYICYGEHGYDSVQKICEHIDLTDEERFCIEFHMGAYQVSAWKEYDMAIRKYPNVLWTHTADMYASKVLEV